VRRAAAPGAALVAALLAAVSAVTASLAAAGSVPEPPTASADARLGTLHVTSGIVVSPSAVDLRGVWQDRSLPCSVSRRLTVKAQIYFTPAGRPGSMRTRIGRFRTPNCAEGGPNVGFTLTARQVGYACPNGRWRPGRLSFVVFTTEPTRGLRATASLGWRNAGAC